MKKRITSFLLALCLIVALAAQIAPTGALAEEAPDESIAGESPVTVSNYAELLNAVIAADEGDTITIAGIIQIQPSIGFNDIGKNLTLRRDNPSAFFALVYADGNIPSALEGFTFDGAGVESNVPYVAISHNTTIRNVQFINCNSTIQGGAVSVAGDKTVSFENCTFDNNQALQGGHLGLNSGAIVTIADCTFRNGEAQYGGGAIMSSTTTTISGSTFTGNHAGIAGGGICGEGNWTISTTKFYGNTADEGGADIAHEQAGRLELSDNLETLTSIYTDDGLVPLGWVYDYSDTPMIFTGEAEFPQFLQLKMKFQAEIPPVDPEPEEPADPDPVEPEEPGDSDPDETPSPEPEEPTPPSQPSDDDNDDDGYEAPVVISTPKPEQPIEPRLACGEAVLDPSRADYLTGLADGAMGQNMTLTRAKAVQAIFRLLTPDSLKKVYSESGVFIDISADDWYSAFVNTLQKSGVVAGCGNGLFMPEKNLTWGEMITLFTRFTDAKPDNPIPLQHWSADAVSIAASLGWMEYHSEFNPNAEVTIQEFTDFASGVLAWATTT